MIDWSDYNMNTNLQKSKRLVSYKEFIAGKNLKRTFLAGFRRYAKKEYMTEQEWNSKLSEYQKR